MAVKFSQKQVQQVAEKVAQTTVDYLQKDTTEDVVIQEKVDRLLYLDLQLAPLRPALKEFETIKKSLHSIATTSGELVPEETVSLYGDKGMVSFSPCVKATEVVDMNGLIGALKAKIGYPALVSLLKINVTDVAKYLSASEMEKFYAEKHGSRRMTLISEQTQ